MKIGKGLFISSRTKKKPVIPIRSHWITLPENSKKGMRASGFGKVQGCSSLKEGRKATHTNWGKEEGNE